MATVPSSSADGKHAEEANSDSELRKVPRVGSPYCSDPQCKSCKDLRQIHEEVTKNKNTERLPNI
jgi:hypothetical protein